MSRFFIEEVKRAVGEDGFACGPVGGEEITTIKYRKDDEPAKWLTLILVGGVTNFYLEDEDRLERHINLDPNDDDEIAELNGYIIDEFEGISFDCNYDDIYDQIFEEEESNPAAPLLRYIIAVSNWPWSETEEITKLAEGKYIDEVDIPVCDAEQDYLDMLDD